MDPISLGVVSLFALTALLFSGMRIAFATALCGFIGLWMLQGYIPEAILASQIPLIYTFLVLPLFIMMGFFAYYAGITKDLY